MARTLPRLRRDLDLLPSPIEDRPGLLMCDPFRYSPAMLVLPPPLVPCLSMFDGAHDEGDLRSVLVRLTGELEVSPLIDHLESALSGAGFLEDAAYEVLRETRRKGFREQGERAAIHAGSAYPDTADALRATLDGYLAPVAGEEPAGETGGAGPLAGIAAPHVSPEGGWRSYGSAYRRLAAAARPDQTFLVLGTSHHGERGRFGITRKPYATPLGATTPDGDLAGRLIEEGGPAAQAEDYCHAIEHSIEFQVVFLQHLFGPAVRVVPVLCGPLAGPRTDAEAAAQAFVAVLSRAAAERGDVVWVLGVDLAHVGQRYGDGIAARAGDGVMARVEGIDRLRLGLVAAGDGAGFRDALEPGDPLKWCGSTPIATFLAAEPAARGTLLRYEQWNIDETSVVSFAALAFHRG